MKLVEFNKSEHTHIQIKTGDRITLEVWDGADNPLITPVGQKRTLMQDIVVSEAGIFVPYVGTVNVNSLSQDQAREKSKIRWHRLYLPHR